MEAINVYCISFSVENVPATIVILIILHTVLIILYQLNTAIGSCRYIIVIYIGCVCCTSCLT